MEKKTISLHEYIAYKGGAQIAREIGATRSAVSLWKRFRSIPHPRLVARLISTSDGLLDYKSVYADYVGRGDIQIEMDV